jgi:hypothetical protein
MPGRNERLVRLLMTSGCVLGFAAASPATAQSAQRRTSAPKAQPKNEDPGPAIIVTGERNSIVKGLDPLATLDHNALDSIGATSMSDLLRVIKPLTQSADGGDPIFLLNGQRVSSYQEIGSLPPEAIDKVEILPEPAALRFGYPPTRRVVNFITKRNFRQIEASVAAGTTIRPGSSIAEGNFNLTRLHKDQRITLTLQRQHASSLLQSNRHVLPNPQVLFDSIGNITAPNGGEIDPALSQIAGQPVTVVPVPETEADRSSLPAYAAGANQPRLFDLGPYRTLVPRKEEWKAESVLADKIGSLSGSLDLSAEQTTETAMSGPAAVTLTVPASNPYSPFASTVLLHRYLTEAGVLHTRQTTTTLHGGSTLRGAVSGWLWDWTASIDQKLIGGFSENGIDLSPANAAIAAGADPFVPLDPSLLSDRLVDRAHLLTRTMNTKLVVRGMPVQLPAGPLSVTGTVEAERLTASSVTRGADPFNLQLGRTRTEAGIAVDIPLTSRSDHVLSAIGDLSLNGSANARRVSGFGSLYDTTLGATWGPFKGIQLLLQDKRSGTAPDMEKLASPIVHVANVPVFDFATGRTDIVTVTTGGNPDLAAEKKHVRSIALNVKPFPGHEVRVAATYEDTEIRNQTGQIEALTPGVESEFPDLFVRDSTGHLVSVTFQPTNFYRERQKSLNIVVNAGGPVGKKPPGAKNGQDGRPNYYAGAGPTIRFSDRMQLRPDSPKLDLLGGDSVNGWKTARVSGYFYAGIGQLGNSISIDGWGDGDGRVRSPIPTGDLRFSPTFQLNFHATLSVHHFLRKQAWTKHLQLKLDLEKLVHVRQTVRDRNGNVPNQYQPDLLDPVGRTVKFTVRKLF